MPGFSSLFCKEKKKMAVDLFANVVIVVATTIVCVIIYSLFKFFDFGTYAEESTSEDNTELSEEKEEDAQETVKNMVKPRKGFIEKKKEVKDTYTHPWLLSNLKGHGSQVLDLDFSPNGKFLASCADDRSILFWTSKTFCEKNHKSVRTNIEYDYATHIKWSPDGKAFIICVANENSLQVYKVGKKKDNTLGNVEVILRFPVKHNSDIINIGISCNGSFIMSCSSDTNMVIWDLKGEVLTTIDTLHINNYYACVSPCGRFVASSGFTPDVRVWEVMFSKAGDFKEVKRAFELKGHTSGVYNFCFSNDSSRMVTISKDGSWKLWDTNIEYSKGQEPYLLRTSSFETSKNSLIALSADGRTVAACSASTIWMFSAVNGELQATLSEIHPDPIRSLLFSPDGQYLLAAAGRHIRMFKNIPGYQNTVMDLEESKKHAANQSTKERLQSQIEDAKSSLTALEELTVK